MGRGVSTWRALIVRLELTLSYVDGPTGELRSSSGGLFVERNGHHAMVEQQIAELASGDFVELAEQLVSGGHEFDADELGQMYVHVDMDGEVRRQLEPNAEPRPSA